MATKLDLKTVFMKLLNVFPKDMYLVHNWCAIAGNESDVENRGFYFCVLEPEVRELLNKTFPNNPVLYIKSVRDAKTNISDIEEILDETILKNITAIVESFMSKFNNYDDWNTFNFTEEEISALFDEGQSLTLFENDDNRSSIIISKSIFPLVTGKVINEVKYIYDNYEDDDQLNQIIIVYDYELFQLVMRYLFLKI